METTIYWDNGKENGNYYIVKSCSISNFRTAPNIQGTQGGTIIVTNSGPPLLPESYPPLWEPLGILEV